jgi:hypothetical protein
MTTDAAPSAPYVSTGNLPPAEHVRLLVNEAYERFRANAEGELSHVYPSLTTVDPDRFGICVANTRGLTAKAGDADVEFSIMSVAKPFVFALMCGVHTPNAVAHFVGLNATGKKFNSVGAIEDHLDGRTNPMVNPGQLPRRAWLPATTWKKSGVSSMRVCLVLPGVNYKSMRRFSPRPRPRIRSIAPSVTFCGATAGLQPIRSRRWTSLHETKLPEGHRQRPCCDGGDCGVRRCQSVNGRAGRRSGELPLRPSCDGNCWAV